MYSSTLPSTSALDGIRIQCHVPATLSRERPSTHIKGGWVSHRTDQYGAEKLSPTLIDVRTVQPIASHFTDCAIPAPLV